MREKRAFQNQKEQPKGLFPSEKDNKMSDESKPKLACYLFEKNLCTSETPDH